MVSHSLHAVNLQVFFTCCKREGLYFPLSKIPFRLKHQSSETVLYSPFAGCCSATFCGFFRFCVLFAALGEKKVYNKPLSNSNCARLNKVSYLLLLLLERRFAPVSSVQRNQMYQKAVRLISYYTTFQCVIYYISLHFYIFTTSFHFNTTLYYISSLLQL